MTWLKWAIRENPWAWVSFVVANAGLWVLVLTNGNWRAFWVFSGYYNACFIAYWLPPYTHKE